MKDCWTSTADLEVNETLFHLDLAEVLSEPPGNGQFDKDKDHVITMLDLYLTIARRVLLRYKAEKNIPTEHAQLDDNGDGRFNTDPDPARDEGGLAQIADFDTLAAFLPEAVADGPASETLRKLTARVQALERYVILLRNQKAEMSDKDYWQQLEPLLIDLARSSRRLKFMRADLQIEYP